MSAKILTGYTGERHITPLDDAAVYRSIFGPDSYITREGDMCVATMPSINKFDISGGQISIQGIQTRISAEELPIDTCATGKVRIDLIVARYTHDNDSRIDAVELRVLKGTEVSSSNTPQPPAYNTGSINDGATIVDFPLYRIDLAGSTVTYTLIAPRIDVALYDMLIPDGAAAHNAIYRGKYLGDSVTDEQWEEIQSGRFHDLFIGDYWTIGGINYRIADFDYWLHMGDTECTTHHIVIVPDECLYTAQMNTSNVVTGAYVGSRMYTANLATAKSTVNSAFGSAHVLTHREYLKNAVTNGYETAGAWYNSTVELMSEEMVYGGLQFKNRVQGTNFAYQHTIDMSQLNLFRHDHSRIVSYYNDARSGWWLRDVAGGTYFAFVNSNGNSASTGASGAFGVRPAFGIC